VEHRATEVVLFGKMRWKWGCRSANHHQTNFRHFAALHSGFYAQSSDCGSVNLAYVSDSV